MIVGHVLYFKDNDSHMLGNESKSVTSPALRRHMDWRFTFKDELHPAICRICGRKTDRTYVNPKYKAKNRKYDVGITYDGYRIVSKKFKLFCERQNYKGVEFVKLPSDPEFFWFKISNIVEYDLEKSGSTCENYCDECNAYSSITGPSVILRDINRPLEDGFYRTDIEFGTSHEQFYLVVVGLETGNYVKKEKFRGIWFEELWSESS